MAKASKPVVGVIGNSTIINDRHNVQAVGQSNMRAVADVAGALPLMFAGTPEITDIGALLDWVAKQPDLDAGRVSVMGGSYGGYMVLASMMHFSDSLRCGIDVVGISNFVTFLQNTQDYRRDLRRAEYGDERDPKMRAHLEKISPANHASTFRKPLFVVQGKNDPRVPFFEAEQIAARIAYEKLTS